MAATMKMTTVTLVVAATAMTTVKAVVVRGWQWLATVAAEAEAEATGTSPNAKDGEAGGGVVDKLIPSLIFCQVHC